MRGARIAPQTGMANHGIRLWLDSHRPAPEGWTIATSLDAARSLLAAGVDQLSLDADVHGVANNGLALVLWMARTGSWPRERPIAHGNRLASKVIAASISLLWPMRERLARLTGAHAQPGAA